MRFGKLGREDEVQNWMFFLMSTPERLIAKFAVMHNGPP